MAAHPFQLPVLNRQSTRTSLSPSSPPDRSSLPSLPLQDIFNPTLQALWASTVFFQAKLPFHPHLRRQWWCSLSSLTDTVDPLALTLPSPQHHFCPSSSLQANFYKIIFSTVFSQDIPPWPPHLNSQWWYYQPAPPAAVNTIASPPTSL